MKCGALLESCSFGQDASGREAGWKGPSLFLGFPYFRLPPSNSSFFLWTCPCVPGRTPVLRALFDSRCVFGKVILESASDESKAPREGVMVAQQQAFISCSSFVFFPARPFGTLVGSAHSTSQSRHAEVPLGRWPVGFQPP